LLIWRFGCSGSVLCELATVTVLQHFIEIHHCG